MEQCSVCKQIFGQRCHLLRHQREQHGNNLYRCNQCSQCFQRREHLLKHKRLHMKRSALTNPEQPPAQVRRIESDEVPSNEEVTNFLESTPYSDRQERALRGYLTSYRLKYTQQQTDPINFMTNMTPEISRLISTHPDRGIKLWICLKITFEKATDPTETIDGFFCCKQKVILPGSDQESEIESAFPQILSAIDSFEIKGSGWVIQQIQQADIHFSIYQPLRGSSYKKLPSYLEHKHAIVNPRNNDEKCFMWAVLAALHPANNHTNRISKYANYIDDLSFTGIEFPVQLSQISKFEQQNNLSVNVYGYEEGNVYPIRISNSTQQHVDLMLYEGHYSWIKSLDGLLFDQRKHKTRKFFCPRCLIPKYSEEARTEHLKRCGGDPTRVEMPKDTLLKFQNIHRTQRQPLVVYADFECLTEEVDQQTRSTQKYQHHIPCGYGLVESFGCCTSSTFSDPSIYRGDNTVRRFLLELVQISLSHQEKINNPVALNMTRENWQNFNRSLHCHICQEYITGPKVKDHCHFCGKFRGAAHSGCNAGFRLNRDVTVVFHNLKRYDGHLIMQKLGELCKDMGLEINVVAKGMEEYISFSIKNKPCKDNGVSTGGGDDDIPPEEEEKDQYWSLKFIDSFQFLTNSLEGLVSNSDRSRFRAMESQFEGEELELLLRKGVFPYDWLNKWEKFDYPLPMKAQFYSRLNNTSISDDDYAHAKKVWRTFKMRNMGQYHDLYLKTDVLLLADVFEEFRGFCLENYQLDPVHYMTLPSFGWDACLKMTKVQLDLLQDPEMYTFLESGIRGGISMISHRYAKANNSLVEGFDASKPTSYITYLDANNLYGWSMVQSLPTSNFKWVDNVETLDWRTMSDDSPVGCILEVDLKYPEALHDAHNSYPLAPERLQIKDDLISPYCAKLKHKLDLNIPIQEKLVPNLLPKTSYVVHYRNLQFYESQGLVVTKVHSAIQFQQSPWMKPYIEFNTEMRKQAKTPFEKDLFKLLNNAVFGKTMENVRNYKDVKLVTSDAQFRKLAANPRYKHSAIFTEDLVAVKMKRASTTLCKPIYIGFTVLELSKTLMYNFHYGYVSPKYGDRATLLFTDTDSLCYHIETDDIYDDMLADSHLFDTSDYPQGHPLHSNVNKKVPGKMKDETAGSPITEFCGLRSKMYSFMCDGIEKKRAKGIKKGVVKAAISHQDYVNTLFGESSMRHSMNIIRSEHHEVYSTTLVKKSLSAYDDKRYLMDNVSSFAYGHVATNSFIG